MPLWRRSRPEPDWFICPVCGARVAVGAAACRECGSDETTGWSEASFYDDLDLPEAEQPLVPDTFEEFVAGTDRRRWPTVVTGILLVISVVLWLASGLFTG